MIRWLLVPTAVVGLMLGAGACDDDDKDKTGDGAVANEAGPSADGAVADTTTVAKDTGGVAKDVGAAEDGASGLKWYKTCGDSACRPAPDGGPPADACGAGQKEGELCTERDASCALADACGARLLCTDTPPDLSNCPISRRRYKKDIRYLDAKERERLLQTLLEMKLARYRLKTAPGARRPKLGFIIDDQPTSVAVHPDGETVDLYGYTSLVAAAVQAQASQIDGLRREVKRLQKALGRCR